MDRYTSALEDAVLRFMDATDLMNFAATWGIQESPAVIFRLFQLQNPEYDCEFVDGQLDTILSNLVDPPTPHNSNEMNVLEDDCEPEPRTWDAEMNDLAIACLEDDWDPEARTWDEEMDDLARVCLDDHWDIQDGRGSDEPQPGPSREPEPADEPQPGPSRESGPPQLLYTIRKKSERTYAKNAAVDTTYQVKIGEQHRGQRLIDIQEGLHRMFDDVLDQARGDLAGNDLGRVVIHHEGLQDPIIVPLQPWDDLNSDTVLGAVEKVLNSNQDLSVDNSFEISIGSIDLPKGGKRRRITRLHGKNNSLQLKKSIVTIENDDQLCMARAIGIAWAKRNRCTPEEWKNVVKERGLNSNLELCLKYGKVPESYYMHLRNKQRKEQRDIAVAISRLANVPIDRPASLNDISAFEEAWIFV